LEKKTEDIFYLLSTHFPSHKTDLFVRVKLKKFKSMEKYELQNYEINISKKLPFCNEKSILPKTLPF